MPTHSRALSLATMEFIPRQYERESSILSTDSRFDPNDHFHNPLLDPRYLAFLLRPVYQRVQDPTPNFFSCIVVPVERLVYLLWFEHPSLVVHLKESSIHCTRTEFVVSPTTYPEDHHRCVLGFTPDVANLFPSGQGNIFSRFFLKEDICYPWLWSLGLWVARNHTCFRQAWLWGEVDFGKEYPGRFFCSLLFIQKEFAKFVIDIGNYVINPAADKIAVCNRAVLAAQLALGVDKQGDWTLSQGFWQYFTDMHGPDVPHASFLSCTLHLRRTWVLFCYPLRFKVSLTFWSFYFSDHFILLYYHTCCWRVCSASPLLLYSFCASYIKYSFPSCTLEYLSYYSNSFAEMINSSTRIPNLHYLFEVDFISAEELEWQCTPGYYGVEYLSKEGQRKENQKDWTMMQRYQKRAQDRDRHLAGLLPPRWKAGTHNGKHRHQQRLQRLGTIPRLDVSLPNGQYGKPDNRAPFTGNLTLFGKFLRRDSRHCLPNCVSLNTKVGNQNIVSPSTEIVSRKYQNHKSYVTTS